MEKIKNSDEVKKKATKKSKFKRYNRKAKIFIGILILVCILIISVAIFLIRNVIITNKYSYYTEKMNWYGYNLLYDNESAKATEYVKSEEIAKMVVGVLYNETNTDFANKKWYRIDDTQLSVNETWLGFAKSIPLTSANYINVENKVDKLQVVALLIEGVETIYEKNIEITETLKEKYRKNYTESELEVIDKGISIGILENNTCDIDNDNLLKGELNKMLITVSEKYSMVYYNNIYSKDNTANVVTDKEKLPSNADKYPYIIDSIANEIYEIETSEMLSEISTTPKQVYDIYHDEYYGTEKNVKKYFDAILNIDYRTIDLESFKEQISSCVVYDIESTFSGEQPYLEAIEQYVDFVKENHIILSGKATPLLPIIYSNGMLHYLRCKIEFEVVNADTSENLLLWDYNTTYNKQSVSVYVDIAVSPTVYSKVFRIYNGVSLMSNLVWDLQGAVSFK